MQPDRRNFVLTAAITLLLVALGVGAYELLRPKQPVSLEAAVPAVADELPKVPSLMTGALVEESPASTPLGVTTKAGEFEMTKQFTVVPDKAARADGFRVKLDRGEFMFHLSGVQGLVRDQAYPQELKDQATYFQQSPSKVLTLGEAAYDEVMKLLREKPVTLFTRWEAAGPEGHYFAWFLVEHKPQVHSYLSEILVARGFAFVTGPPRAVPVGAFTGETFLERLKGHEERAKQEKKGAWSK